MIKCFYAALLQTELPIVGQQRTEFLLSSYIFFLFLVLGNAFAEHFMALLQWSGTGWWEDQFSLWDHSHIYELNESAISTSAINSEWSIWLDLTFRLWVHCLIMWPVHNKIFFYYFKSGHVGFNIQRTLSRLVERRNRSGKMRCDDTTEYLELYCQFPCRTVWSVGLTIFTVTDPFQASVTQPSLNPMLQVVTLNTDLGSD